MNGATVAQLIAQGTRKLKAAGVDSAHFDASNLLAAVLDVELRHIPVLRNDPVPPATQQLFAKHLQQRIRREPLQYIIGDTEFYGLRFKCDMRAMVPRPETETLVAVAIDRIAALGIKPVIADIGTGTGIVAICLAQALPEATVYASDNSPPALALACTCRTWARPMGSRLVMDIRNRPMFRLQKLNFKIPSFQYRSATRPRQQNRIRAMANMP